MKSELSPLSFALFLSHTINHQWSDWETAMAGKSDYQIKVDFLSGLDPKQYVLIKASRTQLVIFMCTRRKKETSNSFRIC